MLKAANRNGYASRVNILKYVKVANKWRFAPVHLVNNKLKFDWVLIDGQPERHAEGTYYIEWYEAGKRRRQSVKDSAEILEEARRKVVELDADKAGLEIADNGNERRTRLSDAVAAYLKEMEPPQREVTTYSAYKLHLRLFEANCNKTYIQDVTRDDLLTYIRKVYELGCGARTARNRVTTVVQLLKANGIQGLLRKRDWPRFVDPMRPIYQEKELKALLAACRDSERVLFLFYLLTGMRKKEVRYCTWRDVDFQNHVVRVTAKPQWGFKPKNKEEREIPIPEALLTELKAHKERQSAAQHASNLVSPLRPESQTETRTEVETYCIPSWPELRSVHVAARQHMRKRRVLFKLVSARVPAHICHAEPSRSRL